MPKADLRILVTLFIFVAGCSDSTSEMPAEELTVVEAPLQPESRFVTPEMPDLLDYAATDVPSEPFRFEYRFQSDQLGFTIKANQLNERVISEITFDNGSSFPIELYVNQYRILVEDLIQAAGAEKPEQNHQGRSHSIVVQSISKTHRFTGPPTTFSAGFVSWVSQNLQTDMNRERYRMGLSGF